jgi:serine/threonine protein kinase
VPHATRAGDVLADRYRLVDLLSESGGGRFWRAHDRVLERHVALHVIAADDPRADLLLDAARRSATVLDQRILRVLDAERIGECCFVVNEWGSGTSLDIMLASNGPLSPRRAAWLVSEVADSIAVAHARGVAHGLLSPENVLLDNAGSVKIIGFCVDAALHGMTPGDPHHDVVDLAGLLHAALTGRWAGVSPSAVPRVPEAHGRLLRPRQVRAGVPRPLDDLCDELLNPRGQRVRDVRDLASARGVQTFLAAFVGDPGGIGEAIAAGNPEKNETVTLPAVPEIMAKPHPDDWVPPPPPEPQPEPEDEA